MINVILMQAQAGGAYTLYSGARGAEPKLCN
jgi:hypothetical protein